MIGCLNCQSEGVFLSAAYHRHTPLTRSSAFLIWQVGRTDLPNMAGGRAARVLVAPRPSLPRGCRVLSPGRIMALARPRSRARRFNHK